MERVKIEEFESELRDAIRCAREAGLKIGYRFETMFFDADGLWYPIDNIYDSVNPLDAWVLSRQPGNESASRYSLGVVYTVVQHFGFSRTEIFSFIDGFDSRQGGVYGVTKPKVHVDMYELGKRMRQEFTDDV